MKERKVAWSHRHGDWVQKYSKDIFSRVENKSNMEMRKEVIYKFIYEFVRDFI